MNRNARLVGFQVLRALFVVSTLSAAILSAAHGNHTPEHKAGEAAGVQVREAFATVTMPGAPTGAAYMQVFNPGPKEVVLMSATSPVAERVQFHSMSMDGNIMRMREVTGGIPVPPGGTVSFAPGGMHIMLVGLKNQLVAGSSVPMTLSFTGAPEMTVQLPVHAAGGHHHH